MIAGSQHTPTYPPKLRTTIARSAVPTPAQVLVASSPADQTDVLQTVTFFMGLALVFTKFAMLQEIQTAVMHFNGYLLYIFGIPAILGVLVTGGLQRTMRARTSYYWLGYAVWIFVCVPFSTWRSDSLGEAKTFFMTDIPLLFVTAGLAVSWQQCRRVVQGIGVAALFNLASSRIFGNAANDGRLNLDFGTVANSTDFAAHLLLTLPILLLFVYSSKLFVLRTAALLGVGFGIITILKSGSRGALVALAVGALFVFLRGRARDRIALACLIPMTFMAVLVLFPANLVERLRSFSASSDADQSAIESSESRKYLLKMALQYTFEFPVFGVGPGQFPNYEGGQTKSMGTHGYYHETHNSWLQASSECGIPGGFFFTAGWISTFLVVNRTYRKARKRPDCADIRDMTFCVLLAILCFCTAISFLNFAYFFYGPAMAGVAIAVSRAADSEFDRRSLVAAQGA